MKHDWRSVSEMAERQALGFHILANVRTCRNCGAAQGRQQTYNGEMTVYRGPKVTGYVWTPKIGRCRAALPSHQGAE